MFEISETKHHHITWPTKPVALRQLGGAGVKCPQPTPPHIPKRCRGHAWLKALSTTSIHIFQTHFVESLIYPLVLPWHPISAIFHSFKDFNKTMCIIILNYANNLNIYPLLIRNSENNTGSGLNLGYISLSLLGRNNLNWNNCFNV